MVMEITWLQALMLFSNSELELQTKIICQHV